MLSVRAKRDGSGLQGRLAQAQGRGQGVTWGLADDASDDMSVGTEREKGHWG